MDFLNKYVSSSVIEKLENKYNKKIISSIILQQENVCNILNYFKSLNLDIETILINRLDIFLIDFNHLKKIIEEYHRDEVIDTLRNDIFVLDYLLDSVG